MKEIRIRKEGNYTSHGIGYTEHDGYGGTSDNRWSIALAHRVELRNIKPGETYHLKVNGVDKGEFTKAI